MLSNETLEVLRQRRSTRTYAPGPLSADERDAILTAALQAPTGGGMVLYSIIDVTDQALKDRLAITCDDQPFIATAPMVLVVVADCQKWIDLFALGGAEVRPCGSGDLLLACCDALIAAQNAVVAAESLGIGSCYIGDILENGEEHAELLSLPPHTLPSGTSTGS
jgi:nitroreductase